MGFGAILAKLVGKGGSAASHAAPTINIFQKGSKYVETLGPQVAQAAGQAGKAISAGAAAVGSAVIGGLGYLLGGITNGTEIIPGTGISTFDVIIVGACVAVFYLIYRKVRGDPSADGFEGSRRSLPRGRR